MTINSKQFQSTLANHQKSICEAMLLLMNNITKLKLCANTHITNKIILKIESGKSHTLTNNQMIFALDLLEEYEKNNNNKNKKTN